MDSVDHYKVCGFYAYSIYLINNGYPNHLILTLVIDWHCRFIISRYVIGTIDVWHEGSWEQGANIVLVLQTREVHATHSPDIK